MSDYIFVAIDRNRKAKADEVRKAKTWSFLAAEPGQGAVSQTCEHCEQVAYSLTPIPIEGTEIK